ncbi:Flavin reductase domain protein [Azotobacter vinelandii CA]|uniref:Flavin reductase domain protein n=2 Tax=Azotobacter vinelandii TaxID=354 RepID=C1DP25_AZOVD|nr:flavin reductase family protein [Azotobacter vinelandii]ACO79378.1 Flavin reductase domain protein [Azotobacter vinelandii DJ]AGK16407.1 Flavin reductase domain protein [Azotobacter vinelandii CA]AGK21172.1 Flavin reductase domain protein [Azotobacter vinelandii CA6]SFY14038.1 NADH-FMN oxidoreductase RutF, flavin reductase (DIM6/NTAB) family [Azotobacter vinelandii]GLK59518.1 flavin oxidoreductase [Azotobacter vinelandii]
MNTMNEQGFDSRAFRRALGNFATGITVVSAATDSGRLAGVTANSFNSVSLDPPLVLWSIDKRSSSFSVFEEATHFAVNILAADQIDLSNHFARPQGDKFSSVVYEPGLSGAPLFSDCSARFQCEKYQIVEGGDHWVLIGKVVAFDDFGRAPLLYHQGAYSSVLPHPQLDKAKEETGRTAAFHERLGNNIYYLMNQAVRCYQSRYQPRQLSSGLRVNEARMLMVLEYEEAMGLTALQREVAMPLQEVEQALETLMRKKLIVEADSGYAITQEGVSQAEILWKIALDQQNEVFSCFAEEQVKTFKDMLKFLTKLV